MHELPIRVLLVEDDEDDYVLVRDYLAENRRTRYDLQWVSSPAEALELLKSHSFDVLLVDYRLGAESGLDLLAQVQEGGITAPVIVLTGQGDLEIDLAAMQAGAADYLVKGRMEGTWLERSIRYAVERAASLNALRHSEMRWRALIEHSSEAVGTMDETGTITFASLATSRLLGYPLDALIGHSIYEFMHPDDVRTTMAIVQQIMLEPRQPVTSQYRLCHQDGSWRWFEGTRINLLAEPSVQALVTNFRDITERVRATEAIRRQVERLSALRTIDNAIIGSTDLRMTLDIILRQLVNQLNVDAAAVLLLNPQSLTLEYAAGFGFHSNALRHTRLRLGEGYAGRAALERQVVRIPNLRETPGAFERAPLLPSEAFTAYFGVPLVAYQGTPLIAKGEVQGVLELFHRAPVEPDQDWDDFLETLAGQTAIAIDNAGLFDRLQRSNLHLALAYDTTLEGWSRALDLRDKETEGHSQRVTEWTVLLARALGMSDAELVQVRRGALLHDIGKMGVPDGILLKPGPLNDEEWAIMKRHPTYAFELLSPIEFLRPALDIPYCHHEKWDGTGYPRGLKGTEIPLAARTFAVVDVWDALCSDRPYRASWPQEQVISHILQQADTHFDPQIVETFLAVIDGTYNQPVNRGNAI